MGSSFSRAQPWLIISLSLSPSPPHTSRHCRPVSAQLSQVPWFTRGCAIPSWRARPPPNYHILQIPLLWHHHVNQLYSSVKNNLVGQSSNQSAFSSIPALVEHNSSYTCCLGQAHSLPCAWLYSLTHQRRKKCPFPYTDQTLCCLPLHSCTLATVQML